MRDRIPSNPDIAAGAKPGGLGMLAPKEVSVHLRDVAILTVGPPSYAKDAIMPMEIGLAYCGGASGLTWLVEPEDQWVASPPASKFWSMTGFGRGLPGALVAEQLHMAIVGYRVFSRDNRSTQAWVRRLFTACAMRRGFEVGSLDTLCCPPVLPGARMPTDTIEWAQRQAFLSAPDVPRAVLHAVRDATLVLLLSVLAGER